MKEFKQRHLDFTQIFTSESDYIFYAISVTPERKINSQINIALKKSCTDKFYRQIIFHWDYQRNTSILEKCLYEVLTMIKQLGLPTFLMALSWADLKLNDLISIIATLRSETLTDNDTSEMGFFGIY